MSDTLQKELNRRAARGEYPVTVHHIETTLRTLGYKLARDMDCRSMARWMTGDAAGESYPCISTGIREVDTGRSFANIQARRDSNFRELQELRSSGLLFAVVRGAIFEI